MSSSRLVEVVAVRIDGTISKPGTRLSRKSEKRNAKQRVLKAGTQQQLHQPIFHIDIQQHRDRNTT